MSEEQVEHALQKRDIKNLENSIDRLSNRMEENFDEVHARQNKTNGKVQQNTKWRYLLTGAIIILWLVVVPLIVYIFKTQ